MALEWEQGLGAAGGVGMVVGAVGDHGPTIQPPSRRSIPERFSFLRSTWPMQHRTRRSFFVVRPPSKTSPNPNREMKSRPSNVLRKYSRTIPPNQRSSGLTFASTLAFEG